MRELERRHPTPSRLLKNPLTALESV
jgi:hypothetical protein